ncbi:MULTISPECIES: DUF1934 domain-containing protein [Clostridia]|uniref:DUF1934 domain-containing protein n=1 Tax=Clostridia TaxID=186801 RepID=UPI000E5499B5|nr:MULTISPECIES: DUF1934 domain-containing protein [Clostridia]RHV66163.1 DUF1934 domain-containing protein [Roseburia sp. OM02-15]
MTKDVLITICGIQKRDGETDEPIETVTPGEYYFRNGKHYILYEEVQEGIAEVTKCMIKIGDDSVDLSKKGASGVHMIFQRDKKTRTSYQTPYGSLMLGFDSKMIRVLESEDMIHLNLEYDLEVEEEYLAKCSLTLKVQAKQPR